MAERKAEAVDLTGNLRKYLFARNKTTGHQIGIGRFYRLRGEDDYEREGYVLMTTARRRENLSKGLFEP